MTLHKVLSTTVLDMNKISTKHFMFFIFATCTIALRSYSSLFIQLGGRSSWISAILASVLIIVFVSYLIKICRTTNTYDINVIFSTTGPTWLNNIFKAIFALGLFLLAVESASVESSSIHTNYFLTTPLWYCLLFFIIPAALILLKRFNAILILVIVTATLTLFGDIVLIMLVSKYLDFNNLFPVLENGLDKNLFFSTLMILGSLLSVVAALPFLKFLHKPNGLSVDTTLALILSCALVVSSFISVIAFFSPERAGNIFYPEYIESQRVQIANFIEFGELFYIFRSVCMFFLKYIIASYSIILLYEDIIKNKTVFVLIYSIVIFIACWYVTYNQYHMFYMLKIFQFILYVPFFVIPLLCFSKYILKKNCN